MAGRITPAAGRYAGRSAAERQAERRRRFLEAGLELFGAGPGYRATKVTDVCRAAGLSTRQFYEEFHDLEDLLGELYLHVNDVAERSVQAALPQVEHLGPIDRYTRLFRAYATAVTADPRHTRIAFVEVIGVSPRLDRRRLERRARWVDFLCRQAEAAIARGEIPARDYRVTATAFVGAVNGLMHDWAVGWVDATCEQVIDELLQMLLSRLHITAAQEPEGP
ncbi:MULTISPECIES: TetR/AcrR family transcriptional regulator [Thermomonospora]|uniref:Transcriptional regulator, TetR family n=1 Tax=Thermomonospora curvata (strain ATCC 19995 / DSM 43183 / JCM 3096 / KCTC 9072 / NBRC 15933 / NCIMB 10081 / Henssen B9) TaxID=471852 RepID=D1A8B9_THECD|nr:MULTISPECIES: TetR/AcrR family transcriptional regulator [Thermomonospora]ACZ00434.1 transcriptional regulator, TetR family [Thermomonospora curvata DSM 43183]PKK11816.1 MAG: TetR/AcrR family transcriptional regulator [Thermomonospora sp. CIF 1]